MPTQATLSPPRESTHDRVSPIDRILNRAELETLKEPGWVVDEVIPASSYTLLSGRKGSYKSFAALSLALSVAHGVPWCGYGVGNPGPVLYVAAEGAYGIRKRIQAWEHHYGVTFSSLGHHEVQYPTGKTASREKFTFDPHSVQVVPNRVDMFAGTDLDDLTVCANEYSLIVFDTLRRISGRAEQNSNTDMGVVVDNIETLKEEMAPGGSVLVLAHTGKLEGADTRGASCIEDDADCIWYAERGEDNHFTLINEKMKDSHDGAELSLYARWVAGDFGDSLVVEPANATESPAEQVSKQQAKLIAVLRESFSHNGATATQLQECSGLSKSTVYNALNVLLNRGLIKNIGTAKRAHYMLTGEHPL